MPSIYAANDAAVYEKSTGRWRRRLAMPFIKLSEISEDLQAALELDVELAVWRSRSGK